MKRRLGELRRQTLGLGPLLLGLAFTSGCARESDPLEALGSLLLFAFALAALTVLLFWGGFALLIIKTWRTRSALVGAISVGYALALLAGHVVLFALHAEHEPLVGRSLLTTHETIYLVTSVFPVAALLLAARSLVLGLAPRLGRGLSLGLSALGVGWLLSVGLVAALMGPGATRDARFEQLSVAMIHACGLLSDGDVMCVGANWDGQLGTGADANRDIPARVRGLHDVTQIAVDDSISCALRRDGEAWCWGGEGSMRPRGHDRNLPWRVPGGEHAVSMSVRRDQLYFVTSDGATVGWPRPAPAELGDVVRLRHKGGGACAVLRDGGVTCWSYASDAAPSRVAGIDDAIDVAASGNEGCAVRQAGDVICWVRPGDEHPTRRPYLGGEERAVEIVATYGFCARTEAQHVFCWGDYERDVPTRIGSHDGATALTSAVDLLCARREAGPPVCRDLHTDSVPDDAEALLRWAAGE